MKTDLAKEGGGAGIKSCSIIYEPRGQALEYAPLATNPFKGCGHKCAYCYVPRLPNWTNAKRKLPQARREFDAGATPRDNFMKLLARDARKYQAAGSEAQVMLSFTTDPYHPGDTALTRQVLECLIEHGLSFCTLTKGGSRARRDMDLFRPDRDAFASTLTSTDPAFAAKWESGAAPPADRMETLQAFHERGIFTWVSLEPTLDIEASLAVVEATHRFVDLYKVGRANYMAEITRTTDWAGYTRQMTDLLNRLGKAHYIKLDLQDFLPEGYENPLRVQQHH